MKKTVIVLMGFIAVAMGFAACSSDDDNGSTPPENGEETVDSVQTGTELVVDSAEVWSERDGNRIFGMMYYNSASSKKQPAVILSHSSSLTHEAMSGYALAIAKMGYAAYCFDFCGGSDKSKSDGKTDEMTVFTEVCIC